MTRPNGIDTNYSYDNLSRLLSVLHQSGTSTIDGAAYTLDSAGNRTSKTDDYASVTSNYTYDALYELTQVTQGSTTTESYSYDPVGNRTASLGVSSYTTNSSNEMTANSNASYTYDSNGNTLTKTDSTGTTNYYWDYENHLTSVTLPASAGTVTFKYDPFGRRIEKVSPTATSILVYDGDDLVEATDAAGSEVAGYTEGTNIDEHLAMVHGTTNNFYQQDGLGSVTSLTSSVGSIVQTYAYDSFGNTTASSGSLANLSRFTGRDLDTETGLYYYRARYYTSQIGRFLSEDPLGFVGSGPNFYDYTFNSPDNLIDPTGLYTGWEFVKDVGTFSEAFADVLTIGSASRLNDALAKYNGGGPAVVDRCSWVHTAGTTAGVAFGIIYGATAGATWEGRAGDLFGRGGPVNGGFFNRGFIRFGWYWDGPQNADAIGLRIGPARGFHLPFYYP
jgi:RHS repeat-associated protein